jgi:Cu/Ag efflux protein CusF
MPIRFAAWLLSLAAVNAVAQDKAAPTAAAQGKGVAEVVRVTATVEAIDQATRTVTLKDSKGALHTFVASDEVRNLAQVGKGDVVTLDYAAALAVRLAKTESKVRERTVTEGVQRSQPGQMPGGKAIREVKVIASVEAIDAKAQKVTLRGPQNTVTMKVEDPAMLKGVKKGDMVEAVYVEAVALKVEKAAKK